MAKTQLQPTGTPSRRYGNLDKAPPTFPKVGGPFTQLGPGGYSSRRYGDLGVGVATYSITGDVTTTISVGATTLFSQVVVISGDVTLTVTPAATMDFQNVGVYSTETNVTTDVIPAATKMTFGSDRGIAGDVTLATSVNGTADYVFNAGITGDVTTTFSVGGTFVHSYKEAVSGATTVTTSVAASGMTFSFVATPRSITGDVTTLFIVQASSLGDSGTGNVIRRRRTNTLVSRLGRR